MPTIPDSPESRQIADVAINEEETIVRRPPLEEDGSLDGADKDAAASEDGD